MNTDFTTKSVNHTIIPFCQGSFQSKRQSRKMLLVRFFFLFAFLSINATHKSKEQLYESQKSCSRAATLRKGKKFYLSSFMSNINLYIAFTRAHTGPMRYWFASAVLDTNAFLLELKCPCSRGSTQNCVQVSEDWTPCAQSRGRLSWHSKNTEHHQQWHYLAWLRERPCQFVWQ